MKTWEERVQELEEEGLTRSDAQGVADLEANKGLIEQGWNEPYQQGGGI